jgi:hypothetical protein
MLTEYYWGDKQRVRACSMHVQMKNHVKFWWINLKKVTNWNCNYVEG